MQSFSIQIIKCTDPELSCKTDSQIKSFLDLILFKSYHTSDYLNYIRALNDTSLAPMTAGDSFHKKFSLDTANTIDYNNDLFLNTVDLLNERLWFFMPVKKFAFFMAVPIDSSTNPVSSSAVGPSSSKDKVVFYSNNYFLGD